MEIKKAREAVAGGVANGEQMRKINQQSKGELTQDQVYVFSLRLCDDQIDRDLERFDTQALPVLAKMFVGKTGVVDHKWSADAQVARIFEAEVMEQEGIHFIKAWAYIRRGGHADEVIADIEAGIKKEISVGCAMGRSVCSVCGGEYGSCGHQKGSYYDGVMCSVILKDPVDAYEFSFVAVPAQPNAGVLKGFAQNRRLKELAEEFGAQAEYRALWEQAQLGKAYAQQLSDEVVRLCLMLDLGVEEPVLRVLTEKAGAEELVKLKTALQQRYEESFPGFCQLSATEKEQDIVESGFLI